MSHVATDSTTLPDRWQTDSPGQQRAGEANLIDARSIAVAATSQPDLDGLLSKPGSVRPGRATVCPCPGWKRAMDIVGSIALLAILSPALLGVAVFIRCVSRGPVLFRQRRYGLGGRPFKVWKFRTIEDSQEHGQHRSHVTDLMTNNRALQKRDHQLEIIPGGKLMRKFGIDELPQLINVLKGEMSLVGPRPDVVPFSQYDGWNRRRFDVLPGITGLWQVSGKNSTTFATMMRLDLMYVRQRSFWLDLTILLMTIPALAWEGEEN